MAESLAALLERVSPPRKSKEIPIEEAGKIIAGAKTLHVMNTAMALVRAGLRAGARDLTIIPQVSSSFSTDLLVAAEAVKRLYISYVGFEMMGFAPAYRKAAQDKTVDIVESDEAFIVLGTRAAAGGMPFVPIRHVYEGTDLPRLNPHLKQVHDPVNDEMCYAIPPLHADVALLHVQECDEYGNAQSWGGNLQEVDKAMASKFVIVSTERLVSVDRTREAPERVTIPGHMVHAVVHAPFGAHPLFSARHYDVDHQHLKDYFEMITRGDKNAYLDQYVYGTKNEIEYLERIGLARLVQLSRKV